jgi:hypothetical protein
MRRSITEITTDDTKTTYQFDGTKNDHPELWGVRVTFYKLNKMSGHDEGTYTGFFRELNLERKTLENAGIFPMPPERREEKPTDNFEDLAIRLLNILGFEQRT